MATSTIEHIYIGTGAITQARDFCRRFRDRTLVIAADTNTYAAAGDDLAAALREDGHAVVTVILTGDHIHADDTAIGRVLAHSPRTSALFIAVGSGTITDLTRYVSFRLSMPFISVPTAASVDGYTSRGAPLVIEGVKRTHYSQAPIGIFADLEVLRHAPPLLTAAGVGDMLGKLTSTADWRLGNLLWGEPYDDAIARRSLFAARACMQAIDEISKRSQTGLRSLIDALVESGLCMLEFGESRPASGAEHHVSHLWEMLALQAGGAQPLHGAMVGVATVLVARLYGRIRELSRADARRLLQSTPPQAPADQLAEIEAVYGSMAPAIARDHQPFITMDPARHEELREAILDRWDEIQQIAAEVPPHEEIASVLARVSGPTTTAELGLSALHTRIGVEAGHYLRDRFTAVKLALLLGLPLEELTA